VTVPAEKTKYQRFVEGYWLYIIPLVVVLFILTVGPTLFMFFLSFRSWVITLPDTNTFAGLENFYRMAQDPRFWNSVKVSIYLAGTPIVIQLILGMALALALHTNLKGFGMCKVLYVSPMIIPPVVVGLIWKIMFIPDVGSFNYFLELIGIEGPDWLNRTDTAVWAIIIAAAWEWTPFVTVTILAGLESLPPEPFEAARIDGASGIKTFWFITLPMLLPILAVVILFRIIESLGVLPLIFMMTDGGPATATETINYYAFKMFNHYEISYSSSIIVVIFFTILALSWYFMKVATRVRK
jgi:multiple sugar transport system permease protein